mmetsp:Transcript_24759/g.28236  ORF Transcript_24759/g.28236 Transcript_24759/m.28236 type:complete len:326 (+) Transcript_24759:265-1242(+)|eukprot:CAMPEP_0194178232 /NCGR_PEP_ID=MMETSP0154-20130528/11877_1 /TAXON_ID=1049557 /ORGANISM="Thalassiothrix antarctica, Strain L6-D1" /LENGTH=325 /DNA_ID=CAMNT_0038893109 /DNA_START=251 /DNA_END=1228 /DNA_ORIENTATION=+
MTSTSTTVIELQVNDPVYVICYHYTSKKKHFEGIVAYLGPVKFGDRDTQDDWVGIQLTGDSVGNGKNDGSVLGERYFTCRPSSGIFVRKNKVIRRVLTRLEFLRSQKELAMEKATKIRNTSLSMTDNNLSTTVSAAIQRGRRLQSLSSSTHPGQSIVESSVNESTTNTTTPTITKKSNNNLVNGQNQKQKLVKVQKKTPNTTTTTKNKNNAVDGQQHQKQQELQVIKTLKESLMKVENDLVLSKTAASGEKVRLLNGIRDLLKITNDRLNTEKNYLQNHLQTVQEEVQQKKSSGVSTCCSTSTTCSNGNSASADNSDEEESDEKN